MFEEEDEYGSCYTCLSCGKTMDKPNEKEGNEMVVNIPKATVFCTTEDTPTNTVPPKPEGRKEAHKYYEDNKEQIIADYNAMSRKDVLRKWQMADAVLHGLLKRWGVKPKKTYNKTGKSWVKPDKSPSITVNNDHLREVIKAGTSPEAASNDGDHDHCWWCKKPIINNGTPLETETPISNLETIRVELPADKPSLPTFSDNWPESVQLKWLDVYEKLHVVNRVG